MNVFKLVFLVKAYFKVAAVSVKIVEAIVFLVDPYYQVLLYLIIKGLLQL